MHAVTHGYKGARGLMMSILSISVTEVTCDAAVASDSDLYVLSELSNTKSGIRVLDGNTIHSSCSDAYAREPAGGTISDN